MAPILHGPARTPTPTGESGAGPGGGPAPDVAACRGAERPAPGGTVLLAALLLAAGLPGPSGAQEEGLFLDAGVSHSLAPSGSPVDPSTYVLGGLRMTWEPGLRSRLYGAAYGGLSFEDAAGDWGTATGGFDLWTPVSEAVTLGLAGRGQAFTVGAPFEYRAVEGDLRPRIGVRLGEAWLTLEGRGAVGRSEVTIRDVPELPAGVTPIDEVVTDLWYWGGGPELALPAGPMRVTVGGHAYEARDGTYRKGWAGLSGEAGPLRLSGDVAVWDTPGDTEVTGGITVRIPFGSGSSVNVTGRRSHPDPLLGTPASVQASFTTSTRVVGLEAPEPVPVYRVDRGDGSRTATVTFRVRRPDAGEVVVLGDFSGWEPVPMERRDGVWVAEVEVEPGVHHFGFRVDGEWHVPASAPGRAPDEWGRVNATLVVPE